MIKMYHPDLPEDQVPADTTEEAFEEVWAEKGWKQWEDTSYARPVALDTDTSSDDGDKSNPE